jgi:hypothetical protein
VEPKGISLDLPLPADRGMFRILYRVRPGKRLQKDGEPLGTALRRTTLAKLLAIQRRDAREKTTETAFKRTTLVKQLLIKRNDAREQRQKPLSSQPPSSNCSS